MKELERLSPCKVNLLLNILGKRPDGFHELETLMQPLSLHDSLRFQRKASGVELTCSRSDLTVGPDNLICRAASAFFTAADIHEGVKVHLQKNIPLEAGLGGGSSNAAITLLALNELYGNPLTLEQLHPLAAALGSDVPFFLQSQPALATGRGECIKPLQPFKALQGAAILLVHPGFGIPTAWAYKALGGFPQAQKGTAGRAEKLIGLLNTVSLHEAGKQFYNALEAPVFIKYPLLLMCQEFLKSQGAEAALMSGSGSTTFAIAASRTKAEHLLESYRGHFGSQNWAAVFDFVS